MHGLLSTVKEYAGLVAIVVAVVTAAYMVCSLENRVQTLQGDIKPIKEMAGALKSRVELLEEKIKPLEEAENEIIERINAERAKAVAELQLLLPAE